MILVSRNLSICTPVNFSTGLIESALLHRMMDVNRFFHDL